MSDPGPTRLDRLQLAAILIPSLVGLALSIGAYCWRTASREAADTYGFQLRFILFALVLQGLTLAPYGAVRLWFLGRTRAAYRYAALATVALSVAALCLAAGWGRGL